MIPASTEGGFEVIGLDADDTLWHSENHFALTEDRFRALVEPWADPGLVSDRLLERERANLRLFGYGVKGFTLSMIETAIEASEGDIPAAAIGRIIEWGKELLDHPVELIEGVEETLTRLGEDHRLVLITKGDLFHQESKVARSGLADRFDGIEILSEKSPEQYRAVLDRHGVKPNRFMMVGNSLRSDIDPVVELGAVGVHIPYLITWGHEMSDDAPGRGQRWHRLESIRKLPALLDELVARSAFVEAVDGETAGE